MGWFGEEPGGLNRMYAGLLGSLPKEGVAVRGLVAGSANAHVGAPGNLSFFERREASVLGRLRGCRRAVSDALRAQDVHVVAAHFSLYALPILDLVRGRRFVFHFHGPWASESWSERERGPGIVTKRAIEALVYRRADRLIVLSSAFAQVLQKQFNIAPERIFVVPGGVEAARYRVDESPAAARARLGLPADRPLVVAVRRLVRRVGLEGLINAMDEVRKAVPDALLLIAGRGELAGELLQRIEACGLSDHVRLMGFVSDAELPLLFRACDLSVVPSVALEGFGLSTIESLAAGTPALVTPVGGLPETVAPLDPSLVLPEASPGCIASGISDALRHPDALPSAHACARYARENFDWPVVAAKVLAVYGR